MKPKISPTSPKNVTTQSAGIDELYREQLTRIDRPNGRGRVSVWSLLVAIVLGFFGGVVGEIIIVSYGSEISWLAKLGFGTTVQPSFVSTPRSVTRTNGVADLDELTKKISASVVTIYEQQQSSNEVTAVYLPEKSRGGGFVVTDDGYILVGHDSLATSAPLIVVTSDGQLYPVQRTVVDPATSLAFIKIKASGLSTAAIADINGVTIGQAVVVLRQLPRQPPLVARTSIAATAYRSINDVSSLVQSSEEYQSHIVLSQKLAPLLQEGIVFTEDGEALGIISPGAAADTVIPFAYVKRQLESVLNDQGLSRPYLGLHFIDLATVSGLPAALAQGQSAGALIYSDNEKERPSIVPKSPAQKVRLRKNDIITAVDGQPLGGGNTLTDSILGHRAGEAVRITYRRDGVEQTVKVTLEELKE